MGGIGKLLGLTLNPNVEQIQGPAKTQRTQTVFGGGEVGGIAGINGEITPNYAAQDTTYTNGLGHSNHKFMIMG